jgi:hypothetical protein
MSQERNKNQQGVDKNKGIGGFEKGQPQTGRTPGGFDDKTKTPEHNK